MLLKICYNDTASNMTLIWGYPIPKIRLFGNKQSSSLFIKIMFDVITGANNMEISSDVNPKNITCLLYLHAKVNMYV